MISPGAASPERLYVLIPAFQEVAYIGRTLRALSRTAVEPLVIVNGEDDGTGNIASGFGAEVIREEEQGKILALQAGVRHLQDQGYPVDRPILLTDADSRPLFPSKWPGLMTRDLDEGPAIRSGVVSPFNWNPVATTLRTASRYREQRQARTANSIASMWGPNLAINFGKDDVRDQFLELPHIWPGADAVMAKLISDNSGSVQHSLDLAAIVLVSTRYWMPLTRRLLQGRNRSHEQVTEAYTQRSAPGVVARFDGKDIIPIGQSDNG
jgi:glycosyltransferase involved in cell wall biosynthesis